MGLLWGSNPYQQIALGHRALPPLQGLSCLSFPGPKQLGPEAKLGKGEKKTERPFHIRLPGAGPRPSAL